MQEPNSTIDMLSSRLLRLSNTLGLYSSRRYRDQFGVSLPEWRVLSVVAQSEPTTARDVSRALATDKAWVGLSAEKLKKRGFLMRSSDALDGRRSLLTLTKAGREKHDAILIVARQRQRRLLASLPKGMADNLIASLDILQREADQMLVELDTLVLQQAE